jgi:hypothetical protein
LLFRRAAAALALQEIYQGEADLTLEWRVLRVSFLVIVAFHIVGFAALRQALLSAEVP